MTPFEFSLVVLYGLVLWMLVIFGLHKYYLLYLYFKYKKQPQYSKSELTDLPRVTVQLPVYNEKYVIKRLVDSICALNYPKDLLEIQILDDSSDETQIKAQNLANEYSAEGFDIRYIRRKERHGFKAGALQHGLEIAKGEFLAIFDADFVPKPDFLLETVPYFTDQKIGLVQTRWGHINRNYSMLTRIQSIFLDGHFIIEHTARNRSGRFFNFNGTAGIWRKQAIIDAGGWHFDTLTEDLDLSYRAQLAGWKFLYLPDVVAPAELPVEMNAYKTQQHRWAKGSVQTAKKLLPKIFQSKLPFFIKLEAAFHLGSNLTYLFMTVPAVLMPIILHLQLNRGWGWMAYLYLFVFFTSSLSVIIYYLVSQRESNKNWRAQIPYLPVLMSLGIGMSINNAKAVLEALLNHKSEFKRTPKYHIESSGDKWKNKKYGMEFDFQPIVEICLGSYFTIALISLLHKGLFVSIPFFILFQFGFIYIGLMSFWHSKNVNLHLQRVKFALQNAILLIVKKVW